MPVTVQKTGSIFGVGADAIVCPVNCQGIMGRGVAKTVKELYPAESASYREACLAGEFTVGDILIFGKSPAIIFFPTKTLWKLPSNMEYIATGLSKLEDTIVSLGLFTKIAMPAIGCGTQTGQLAFSDVLPMIQNYLESDDYDVIVFEPQD